MIRQAISCDICAAEKKQTNHWFVAFEQNGELRVGGWNSRNRLKPGSKHLCGQTCLHKLVDEFMARTIASRSSSSAVEPAACESPRDEIDASLMSPAAYEETASSARLIPAPEPDETFTPRLAKRTIGAASTTVVAMPPHLLAEPASAVSLPSEEQAPSYSSRRWRAEAWERERNRELRAIDHHPDIARRRKEF